MANIRPISRAELVKKLKKLGFSGPFAGGKHEYMIKDRWKLTIPNTHGGVYLGKPLVQQMCREIGVSVQVFMDL